MAEKLPPNGGKSNASREKWFSGLARTANPLAERAEMRPTVHEGLADDRPPAPRARFALLTVCLQGMREVSGLPVDVQVLGVEAGSALGQRLRKHRPSFAQQGLRPGATERV